MSQTDSQPNIQLREAMEAQDFTIEKLAKRLGMTDRQVRRLLNGETTRPHPRTRRDLARVLKTDAEELFPKNG